MPDAAPNLRSGPRRTSMWRPFHYKPFALIWSVTLVSNIGSWMYSSAAAWLMTSLDSDPLMVSLVQMAASLPMLLFALPAGALADTIDKRRFLIGTEIYIALVSLAFAAMVWAHLISALGILLFTFLVELGSALSAPAWQSVVPDLVAPADLAPAVAMNSVGVNISRALGPALGGALTVTFGVAMPFWVNAFSNLGTIAALKTWRPPRHAPSSMPAERFISAIRMGLRHARHNRLLQGTLFRSIAFFVFGSCYWALLPLIARTQIRGGASSYGALLGAIGTSAICGVFLLPWLKAKLGPNRIVAAGSIATALAMVLFGLARAPLLAVIASVIAGISWIAVLSSLNISAQMALPQWVRARGLAVYVTVFFGAMTVGSILWGEVSRRYGIPIAHYSAAIGMLAAIPLTWHWKLQAGKGVDLTPSMHWPTPVVSSHVRGNSGMVLVTTEYLIHEKDREGFLAAIAKLSGERGRDGAFAWGIFEDVSQPCRFLETFVVESWLEHLRQHNRVTNADRLIEEQIQRLLTKPASTTHFIAAQGADASNDHPHHGPS